jgi:hypothetical protein
MSVLKKGGFLLSVSVIAIWFIYSINMENYFIDKEINMSVLKIPVKAEAHDFIERINFIENQVEKNKIQQEIIIKSLKEILEQNKKNISDNKIINYKGDSRDVLNFPPTLTPESIQEKAMFERQYFDVVQNNFEMEQKDDNWSINEEQRLRTVLQQEGLNEAAINDIDCRSKTCRANISHKDRVNAEEFLDVLVRSVHNTAGELEFVADEDGGITTVLYLTPNQ